MQHAPSRRVARFAAVCALLVGAPVVASTGGPDLAEPMGWDPKSHEAYFALHHYDESGYAATILRLRLDGPDTSMCVALWWSKETDADSTYKARLRRLTRRLVPLTETMLSTMPSWKQIVRVDTVSWGEIVRYRVRGVFGGLGGTVEAVTYLDPSVRMIRSYTVPELGVTIGLFSFIGIPFEGGYEVQIPALIPKDPHSRVLLEWARDW